MRKAEKKRVKLGEVVGNRRPIAAVVAAFFTVILMLSLVSFVPGQEVYFGQALYLKTEISHTSNFFGKVGSTLSLCLFAALGFAAWMLPIFLGWISYLGFCRRAQLAGKSIWFSMLASIFLLAILSAAIQENFSGNTDPYGALIQGGGGAMGTWIFKIILADSIDTAGSILLFGSLYLICLITIFVDGPLEAAKEIYSILKKLPPIIWKFLKFCMLVLKFPVKKVLTLAGYKKVSEDEEESVEVETQDSLLSPGGKQKVLLKSRKKETADNEILEDEAKTFSKESEIAPNDDISDIRYKREVKFSDGTKFKVLLEDDEDEEISSEPEEEEDAETEEKRRRAAEALARRKSVGSSNSDKDGGFKITHQDSEKVPFEQIETRRGDYIFPSVDLLTKPPEVNNEPVEDYEARMADIVQTFKYFGIEVSPVEATSGPVITRYELTLAPGTRISKVANLSGEIALNLKAESVRIIAPIPGKGTIGVEIPNKIRKMVCMRDIIESVAWSQKKAAIPVVLGKDVTGTPIVTDLAKMPHALIAGSTGSGKSVCINAIISSLLYHSTPQDLRFIMVDPKQVELKVYDSLPHMLIPVVSDPTKVPAALNWLCTEMERRYTIFMKAGVRNISGFNAKILKDQEAQKAAEEMDAEMTPEERIASAEEISAHADEANEIELPSEKIPYIVCIVDELADIMVLAKRDVEALIMRLTAKARAAGIHVILATQRPSVDVITGTIKSNLTFRIAFKVMSAIDSRTILDKTGAEMLIGNGDMLYGVAGAPSVRAQGAFVSEEEVSAIVEALKVNGEPEYVEEVSQHIENYGKEDSEDGDSGGSHEDPMVAKAIEIVRTNKKASTSLLQRKLQIGYGRAARIIDILEDEGIIGPDKGPGSQRDVFI